MTEATTNTEGAAAVTEEPGYWVTIPGGPFTMGVDAKRSDGRPSVSAPAHTVHVETFRIARRPVSVSDFARFVEATSYVTAGERLGRSWVWVGGPDDLRPGEDKLWLEIEGASWRAPRGPDSDVADKGDHPVTHVSYEDCVAYCRWAGTRLPTEAEWEKAARGTDGRRYAWGEDPPTPSNANYAMIVGDTTPIGSYPDAAGPYGVEDISGNVWEWTATAWHLYPYEEGKARTIVTRLGASELLVVRGGSFFNDCSPRGLEVWVRLYSLPQYSGYDVGFRVCAVDAP
jgi:formylglycine-generating enzyme